MSWLYSIVFAGLLFSSNNDAPTDNLSFAAAPQPPAIVAAVAQGDEKERFEQSYPISANGRVSVSNVNGSIVVEAWDRNEVKLEAVKTADTREALSSVQLKISSRADYFSVEADYDSWRRDQGEKGWKNQARLEVQFKLTVPKGAILDEVETVNGSVTVSNFTNITKVSAVNGNVNAANIRGTANLSTVNGEVMADFDRLETGSRISLNTVNGRVSLTLPSDVNATLKADSLNGEIRNDFGLPVRKGKYVGRDMYGRIGSGDVQVKLESVNGSLTVLRKNDGKSPNPATDLLPRKSADDDNEDWDDSSSLKRKSKNDKLNKDMDNEIAKAMRDSSRTAAEGMKIAQEELARLAPELEKIKVESLENIPAIDQAEINRQVNEGLRKQNEALSRLRNVNWSGVNPIIEKKTNFFPVKGTPKVSVEAKGCSVKIMGWDRNEVKYVLTEVEGPPDRKPLAVDEAVTDSTVSLKVLNNERAARDMYFGGGSDSVRIEVFVPRKSNLKIVSNGEIRLDGVSGEIDLSGVDEAIDIRNVDGKLKLSAVDGQVRIIGFSGELDSKTGDGDVYLEGNFSRINGHSGDGSVILTVPENYNADIVANVEALTVENLRAPETVEEGQWRFGSGGRKYTFTVNDGDIIVRSAGTLTATQ